MWWSKTFNSSAGRGMVEEAAEAERRGSRMRVAISVRRSGSRNARGRPRVRHQRSGRRRSSPLGKNRRSKKTIFHFSSMGETPMSWQCMGETPMPREEIMANVKLLLKESIKHVGKVGDVVEVSAGYARNYLLPKDLAVEPTANNVKKIEARRKEIERLEAEKRASQADMITKLQGVEVMLERRANEQ